MRGQPIKVMNGYDIIAALRSLNGQTYVVVGESPDGFVSALVDSLDDREWYWGEYLPLQRDASQMARIDAREWSMRHAIERAGYGN